MAGVDTVQRSPWLVVGLGNPGPKYAFTRHNLGVMVIEELASRQVPTPNLSAHKRSNANIAEFSLGGAKVILATPRTYMNVSGGPVRALADFFKVRAEHIIVAHDELELDPGQVRLKSGGGDKGHNGLKSITKALGTKDYYRLSCGIGRPPGRMDPAAYVLKPFASSAAADVAILCADASDAAEQLIQS
ncbi:aminoacyl-tRNA hydrolase [Corynebacterium dentalis]|uniref:aminoacyl-tRNA hydrolase n=1 Tax=Corynebacterium dentalis TaxID=2014528 RepID=UPI0035E3E102